MALMFQLWFSTRSFTKSNGFRRYAQAAPKDDSDKASSDYEFLPTCREAKAGCLRVLWTGQAPRQQRNVWIIRLYTPDMDFVAVRVEPERGCWPRVCLQVTPQPGGPALIFYLTLSVFKTASGFFCRFVHHDGMSAHCCAGTHNTVYTWTTSERRDNLRCRA